jgi:hypothetical protein
MFFTCGVCSGQNLVPNGDFEQYIGCPQYLCEIDSATFWICPHLYCSSDYYNACSPGIWVSIPANYFGYQQARSGNGYAGMYLFTYDLPEYREYIEVQLTIPLTAGTCYHFEMYINLPNSQLYTSDAVGAYFSDTLITDTAETVFPFFPQVNNQPGNFPDSINWTQVSGNFMANGGEGYLIIGNFKNDSITTLVPSNNIGWDYAAYIYIDDVSLTPCTAIDEQNKNETINIFPNPFSDKLNITVKNNEPVEAILFDITARKLLQGKFTNSVSINTEQLAKGLYLYEVRNKNGVIKKGKVVKD